MKGIEPVHIQVALKSSEDASTFTFSRVWTSPRTILHLASGQLALANVTFLVADDALACEELLIGLPVLRHLQVDTRTLLENNRLSLDGADCSHVGNPTRDARAGIISRVMIARMNRVQDGEENKTSEGSRPRENYYKARREQDPFPDPSLLDPIDSAQHSEIIEAMNMMKVDTRKNGLPDSEALHPDALIDSFADIFRISLSSRPPAKLRPLKIELLPGAKPVRVRLRNYTQEQREFLSDFVSRLQDAGMVILTLILTLLRLGHVHPCWFRRTVQQNFVLRWI